MKKTFWLFLLIILSAVVQGTLVNPYWPPEGRPEIGLYLGLAGFAFLPRRTALWFLFFMGLQADLLDSFRFGAWTLGYLTAGGLLLGLHREISQGSWPAAWGAMVIGTGLAHGAYLILAILFKASPIAAHGMHAVWAPMLTAAVLGGFCAYLFKRLLFWTGTLASSNKYERDGTANSTGLHFSRA